MKNIAVIFGGKSAEHDVSIITAHIPIIESLRSSEMFDVWPIYITREGRWYCDKVMNDLAFFRLAGWEKRVAAMKPVSLTLNDGFEISWAGRFGGKRQKIDIVFPSMHGTYGEDGTIQGLFELADVPYVGAGVLGSAVGMDKVVQKHLLQQAKIPVAPGIWFLFSEFESHRKKIIGQIEKKLRYPCFVKPANMGSSVGISKAHNKTELIDAIFLAGEFDRKILVEKGIEQAREIECSVLGNDDPTASVPGEIIPSNEFYDYDAKYVDGKSAAIIPAKLLKSVTRKIQEYAVSAFKALSCEGMARVDFLVTKKTNKIFLNEINTIPGFTSISMYPKLWQASGLSYPALLDKLIELAIDRHEAKKKLKTSYTPKKDWYKS